MTRTAPKIEDGPKWQAEISVRGVTIPLVSPLEIADLPLAPVPDQAEIDRQTGRRPGALVRLWRWLFGDPRLDRSTLPADGGAAHARVLALAMCGEHYRDFLDTLTTGEIFGVTQYYMGAQARWAQAIHDYGAACADAWLAESSKPAINPNQTAEEVHSIILSAYGPPRRGYATGIVADEAAADGHGDHAANGRVYGPGGPA